MTPAQRETVDEVRWLLHYFPGSSLDHVALCLRKSPEALRTQLRRAGRRDLIARMTPAPDRGAWTCGSLHCHDCGPGAAARRRRAA